MRTNFRSSIWHIICSIDSTGPPCLCLLRSSSMPVSQSARWPCAWHRSPWALLTSSSYSGHVADAYH